MGILFYYLNTLNIVLDRNIFCVFENISKYGTSHFAFYALFETNRYFDNKSMHRPFLIVLSVKKNDFLVEMCHYFFSLGSWGFCYS